MAEMSNNYDPGPWKGWDYSNARKAYDPTAGRSYASTSASSGGSVRSSSYSAGVPDKVTTQAKAPIIIVTDGTGSMGDFPRTIFQKLPLLDDCVKDYLEDVEISFAIIGDAASDDAPLQVQPFGKGLQLAESLGKLWIEGGGGGNQEESYDLAALYYLHNMEAPKAVHKPILIFICDEGVYKRVAPEWAEEHAKVKLEKGISDKTLFAQLTEKFSVYCIRKHYGYAGAATEGENLVGLNLKIHQQWEGLLSPDRVAIISDPNRVVDLILGLLANETDKLDFFEKEINHRQRPEQVEVVMKSMVSIAKKPEKKSEESIHTGLSIANRPSGKTKGSKSLLE